MTPTEKAIRVLLKILARPYGFTRQRLAEDLNCDPTSITRAIKAIGAAGIEVEQEPPPYYRYTINTGREFKELKFLQALTDDDRATIERLLNANLNGKKADNIRQKLASLYDFQKLGLRSLRRPVLERIDALMAADKAEKRVVLENYRSNSGSIKDRLVEPFHILPELDMVQAYDVEGKDSRHFKISRIERVVATNESWGHKKQHNIKPADVFRIAGQQVMVNLRLEVQAYNILLEQFPTAQGFTTPGTAPNTFDFQAKVNAGFLGITNFILSNAEHVEILYPDELKQAVRERAQAIAKRFE